MNAPLLNHHSAPNHLPLLRSNSLDAPIAYYQGQSISTRLFLAQASELAVRLPTHCYAINLCENPYLVLLSFAAALLRGQTNLLPPSRLPSVISSIATIYPDCYLLCEQPYDAIEPGSRNVRQFNVAVPEAANTTLADEIPQLPGTHIAAILFTSGSTGSSVAYPRPWHTLVTGAELNARAYVPSGPRPTVVGTVPAQHSYGFETMVMLCLQGYCVLHGERPFFPQDIHDALHDSAAPRVLITTPVHLRSLVAAGLHMPAVTMLWSATAPLSAALALQSETLFAAPLREVYGCTEAGSCATRRTTQEEAWTLHDTFTLRSSGLADSPVIVINAPHLPSSVPLPDQLEILDHARFQLIGRGADLINIAGRRASLIDLNSKLLSIKGVVDGVIFLPDESSAGQQPATVQRTAALVVAPTLNRAQVLAALRELIDAAFMPRPLFMVEALPRNEVTKLPRNAVLKMLAELSQSRQ